MVQSSKIFYLDTIKYLNSREYDFYEGETFILKPRNMKMVVGLYIGDIILVRNIEEIMSQVEIVNKIF